jgi:hypothetical protein
LKINIIYFVIINGFILCGCITEYEADVDEVAGILVVEGIITDDESVIILSRSAALNADNFDMLAYQVVDAKVYIECDDGKQWEAAFHPDWNWEFGRGYGSRYTIETGKLNPERQYRLKIEMGAHEYYSEFAHPIVTPEIDSVFWTKRGKGQPVNIHVSTQAPDGMAQYYLWKYNEDWETRAKFYVPDDTLNPSICSKSYKSREMLLGTTEKSDFGRLTETIAEIPLYNDRLSFLYRMDVSQNAISKRAFNYYKNVKKNSTQTGGVFAHIPSEIKGNITCVTDPTRVVIGYIDVSSTTRKRLYIRYNDRNVYEEPTNTECTFILSAQLSWWKSQHSNHEELAFYSSEYFILRRCLNCAFSGGRSIYELDEWPNQYGDIGGWYIRYFEK